MTASEVCAVIERETGSGVHPETPLGALGCDSLELAALIIALEEASGKDLADEKWGALESVADLIREFA